jgi:type I restriction enzyme S subunit
MIAELNNSPIIFISNRSELEERFDPEMILYQSKTHSFKYDTIELKKLLKKSPQYGANESGIARNSFKEPRYIRITDINEFGLLDDTIGVTANKVEDKYVLNDNDILFARSGATVGKAYLHKTKLLNYKCFFAGYMIRFVVDQSKILPDYLFTYTQLNIYRAWVKAIQRAAGQPNINAEEYKSLPIPLPPISIQTNIVQIINNAYNQKQQKEAEAKILLQGIDTYILETLGITIPQKQNGIEHRIFTANFSEVVGLRFDPIFFNSTQKSHSDIYDNKTLKSICKILKGQSITKEKITEGEYPVIAGGQSSPYNHGSYNYEGNIITISASGAYSGYVWYHNYPIFASDCIVLQSKNEEEQNTQFIYYVLKALQQEIYKLQQGAGQPHVYARDIEKFTIPIPAMPKQIEMLKHIDNLHHQINTLKADAIAILENAKAEVEKIIIG